jgi:hypothetical protein
MNGRTRMARGVIHRLEPFLGQISKSVTAVLSRFFEENEWKQRAVCNFVTAQRAITYLQTALTGVS